MIDLTRLKDIREDNDITQDKMSQILNVNRSTYALWETRLRIIPLKNLCDFSSYFKLSVDYILGLDNNRNCDKIIANLDLVLLGNNLKVSRLKNGLTQKEMSQILKTSQACIVQYEKGQTCISISNLYKICKKFNVSFNDILTKNIKL